MSTTYTRDRHDDGAEAGDGTGHADAAEAPVGQPRRAAHENGGDGRLPQVRQELRRMRRSTRRMAMRFSTVMTA